jgi:hypothetical protein
MNWLTTLPIFISEDDYNNYIDKPIQHIFPERRLITLLFPSYEHSNVHPLNTVIPYSFNNKQPLLDFTYELCITGKTLYEQGSYNILDIASFKNVCIKYNIRFTQPPVPIFTSPTNNPIFYNIISEYYKLFADAHRIDHLHTKNFERYTTAVAEQRYSASLVPPIAALPEKPPSSEDFDSESSYETVEPPRDDQGNILSATRFASYNHAVRCHNYRNEKLKLTDPTHTYTPMVLAVKATPRKRRRTKKTKST